MFLAVFTAVGSKASTYPVNSTGDASDPVPADGVCGTTAIDKTHSGGPCTLRAAIESANSHAGTDIVQLNMPASYPNCPNGACTITVTQALPDLSTDLSINGPGAAQLIVTTTADGVNQFRVFNVTTGGTVNFSGLTISGGVIPS